MNGKVSKRIRNAAQVCVVAVVVPRTKARPGQRKWPAGFGRWHAKRLKAEYRLQPYHKRDDIAAMLGRPVPSHSEALRRHHPLRA